MFKPTPKFHLQNAAKKCRSICEHVQYVYKISVFIDEAAEGSEHCNNIKMLW